MSVVPGPAADRPDLTIEGARRWPRRLAFALMVAGLGFAVAFAAGLLAGLVRGGGTGGGGGGGVDRDLLPGMLGALFVAFAGWLPGTLQAPLIRFTAGALETAEFFGRRRRVPYGDLRRVNWLFAKNPKYWRIPLAEGRGRPLMVRFALMTRPEIAAFKAELALRAPQAMPEVPSARPGARPGGR